MILKHLCKICESEFEAPNWQKRKYCSIKCYAKSRIKIKEIFNCLHCGKEFNDGRYFRQRKYCSNQCKGKIHLTQWKPSYSCIRKRFDLRGMISQCEMCGYNAHPEILGIHHKDENRKNNDLSNLIVLCPNCHSLQHRKHISH